MGMFKLCLVICLVGACVGDKPESGIQLHHVVGQGGYDSFGNEHAPLPSYDAKGKAYPAPHPPKDTYGPPQDTYGPPEGDIPVVYYAIQRPKKEEKGYFKAFETKMKEMKDKFEKGVKGMFGYDDYSEYPDYTHHQAEPPIGYGPPADSYGPPPTDSYGPPPVVHDSYGPPAVEHIYEYDYEEEKDKGFGDKMKGYYTKFVDDMSKWQEKAAKKMKEMFGYDDYDYVADYDHAPQTGYGVPDAGYGAPPAPVYGAPPAPDHHEHPVIYQEIPRPKKKEKGGFFSKAKGKAPKKPVQPVYHAPPHQPTYHAPQPAPVYHAPVQHAAPHHPAPHHPVQHAAPHHPAPKAQYGPPKAGDITHGPAKGAPVKAKGKGAHVHHAAPAPSSGVSSYTSH